MKFVVALLVVLATTGSMAVKAPKLDKAQVEKELMDFVNLMPMDKFFALVFIYNAEDVEFEVDLNYMKTSEFTQLVQDVESIPEFVDLLNYFEAAGIDIYKMMNLLNNFFGIAKLVPPPQFYEDDSITITGGVTGFAKDIKSILPIEKLQKLYKHKLQTSKVFAEFIARVSSPEFLKAAHTVRAHPNFQKLLDAANAVDIDIMAYLDLVYALFGIQVPTKPYFLRY